MKNKIKKESKLEREEKKNEGKHGKEKIKNKELDKIFGKDEI